VYVTPQVIASFDAADLLGEAFGFGNEGNDKPVGQGSIHSHV
jgi:hypothetical protein